jgi:hypothetical protein
MLEGNRFGNTERNKVNGKHNTETLNF